MNSSHDRHMALEHRFRLYRIPAAAAATDDSRIRISKIIDAYSRVGRSGEKLHTASFFASSFGDGDGGEIEMQCGDGTCMASEQMRHVPACHVPYFDDPVRGAGCEKGIVGGHLRDEDRRRMGLVEDTGVG